MKEVNLEKFGYDGVPIFAQTYDNIVWFCISKIGREHLSIPKYHNLQKREDYKDWFTNLASELIPYYKFCCGLGKKVYLINKKDIKRIYHPLFFLRYNTVGNLKYELDKIASELMMLISEYFKISKCYIGIEGSLLLRNCNRASDIDWLVYGKSNALKIKKYFSSFLNYYKQLEAFDMCKIEDYFEMKSDFDYGYDLISKKLQFKRRFYGFW